ncbi:hypothetical protein VQ042_22595 [Aurantimonas sp. A2-1-M11]|uniref:hypothetical protein n=1 Tax=Aurantimonas sp. A2-1-M11 TaxID=3113712 RepID=UPI002F92C198
MALTIKQISDALGISRSRVEQWISRGHFRTPDRPIIGKARDWDIPDVMRLAIMQRLLEHNLSAETAGYLVQSHPHGFKDDVAFFVAWGGWHEMVGGGKAHMPGTLYDTLVKGSDLGSFLANPDVEYAIVINLDTLEQSVKSDLAKLEEFKGAVKRAGAEYDE